MKYTFFPAGRLLAPLVVCLLACGAAWAEKQDWAGNGGKHKQKDRQEESRGGDPRSEVRVGAYFGDQQRDAAREYYTKQYSAKRCPPGLAKKNNGCMPPGQAKKWAVGHALPRDVIYYPVPSTVSVRLGVPPSGYRYVRVANDILLIAIGTSMVVDAIEDLMRP
jgi:Ni/Co efflux regulator RcnB